MGSARPLLFLDACCLIDLYATGRMREILGALPYRCAVARYVVEHEVMVLAPDPRKGNQRERIDLTRAIAGGLLQILDVELDVEYRELVRFALEVDDGEAHTCALALVRGARVATDDRKVLRILAREGLTSIQTAELLHAWAALARLDRGRLREALRRVETLASFKPGAGTPRAEWWHAKR